MLFSKKDISLSLSICSINLQTWDARAKGLWFAGLQASFQGFLIGVMITSFQLTGILPSSQTLFNNNYFFSSSIIQLDITYCRLFL